MPSDMPVAEHLGLVLARQLAAIHQYFLHARMFRAWGLKKLGEYEYHESLGAMKYADKLIGHILFLEAVPNVQRLGTLHTGGNLSDALKGDLELALETLPELQEAFAHCNACGDRTAEELLEDIMENQQEHRDWIEAQLGLIERTGLYQYQKSQS